MHQMKTSNILIGFFVIISLVVTIISAHNISKRFDVYKERGEMIKGDHSQMYAYNLPWCNKMEVRGENSLNVHIRQSSNSSTKVWVERTYKDSVVVTVNDSSLTISSMMKNSNALVIVYMPKLTEVEANSAECYLSDFASDFLRIKALGNANISLDKSNIKEMDFLADDNASMDVKDNVKVAAWSIHMDGNARLYGISPNSKLNMSVKGNANVSLAD